MQENFHRRSPAAARTVLFLGVAVTGAALLGGCVTRETVIHEPGPVRTNTVVQKVYVPTPPPAPIQEVAPPQPGPGMTWHPGHWTWQGSRYVWQDGRWLSPPPGYTRWQPGRWQPTPQGHIWVEGVWMP